MTGAEGLRLRVDAIAAEVDSLVGSIVELRGVLEASGEVMPPMLSYRLAVILARVDHAAAEVVIQQARRVEAEGQLAAFEELAAEQDHLEAEPFDSGPV